MNTGTVSEADAGGTVSVGVTVPMFCFNDMLFFTPEGRFWYSRWFAVHVETDARGRAHAGRRRWIHA